MENMKSISSRFDHIDVVWTRISNLDLDPMESLHVTDDLLNIQSTGYSEI